MLQKLSKRYYALYRVSFVLLKYEANTCSEVQRISINIFLRSVQKLIKNTGFLPTSCSERQSSPFHEYDIRSPSMNFIRKQIK